MDNKESHVIDPEMKNYNSTYEVEPYLCYGEDIDLELRCIWEQMESERLRFVGINFG